MKTHPRPLIIAFCMAALFFTGAALAQSPSPGSPTPATMKAIVYHNYGSPDVLRLEEIAKPVPNDNQVLVKVRAASVNPLDWHYIEGTPYLIRPLDSGLLKPKVVRLGVDYAGTVEAVGKNVTQFKPGDDVFGGKTGAFAEYVCALADRAVALKPANITFEQAASVPIAAITALQGLRDKGKVQPGQKVLINGASGGVGTFAVQIAKSFRRRCYRRMQWEECRSRPINRCGPGHRLYKGGFHQERAALRPDSRQRWESLLVRMQARPKTPRNIRHDRRRRTKRTRMDRTFG